MNTERQKPKFKAGSFKRLSEVELPGFLQESTNNLHDLWIFWYDEKIMNDQ